MLLRQRYIVDVKSGGNFDVVLPMRVELAVGVSATLVVDDREDAAGPYQLTIDQIIDPDELERLDETGSWCERPDGTREALPALRLKGGEQGSALAWDFVGALSFLTDLSFALSVSSDGASFVAENDDDRVVLEALGTDRVYSRLSGQIAMRTFNVAVEPELIESLLPRREGLRLYADAISLDYPVARFRELWRVLESAFGRQDDELVALLGDYEPAKQIGFDERELKELLVLRGRASHGASKKGLEEILAVGRACGEQVNRLKALVERVIATKETWGAPTTAHEAVLPLTGWVGPENSLTVFTSARAS